MTECSLRIFSVLKTGKAVGQQRPGKEPEYHTDHVLRLQHQFESNFTGPPYEFVCLSDVEIPGVTVIPLKHNWPGWWSKMELFRPDVQRDTNFYLDLDTTIKRDITDMVTYPHTFTALNNLSSPNSGRIGSGIMAWGSGYQEGLYEAFLRSPEVHMKKYTTSHNWGDQGFIRDHVRSNVEIKHWQALFPGRLASYVKSTEQEIKKASIVCFHGKPKPWEVPELKN